jgi:hypothetical protein
MPALALRRASAPRPATAVLLRERDERSGPDLERKPRPEDALDDATVLVCAACTSFVTTAAARIAMSGSHEHTFVNPHGFRYHIGCFAAAPGCAAIGSESSYWTWFPGYAWRIAECRGCGAHLGWQFRGADGAFHGLILDRLAEAEAGSLR